MQFGYSTQKWMDLFTPLNFDGVKTYIGEEACTIVDVQDDGRLTFTYKESNLFSFCLHIYVRVITNHGSNWVLDLDPQKAILLEVGIMENRPISRLTWDHRELYWKVWVQD